MKTTLAVTLVAFLVAILECLLAGVVIMTLFSYIHGNILTAVTPLGYAGSVWLYLIAVAIKALFSFDWSRE